MVFVNGTIKPVKKKCFINGEVHHVVKVDRPKGVVYLFNMETQKQITFSYKDYKEFKQPCYRIGETAKSLNRHPDRIRFAMKNNLIKKPKLVWSNKKSTYYFSTENIFELREYFANVHIGRPRKDGRTTSSRVPTTEELEVKLSLRQMLYVRKDDGTYIPIWKAEEF